MFHIRGVEFDEPVNIEEREEVEPQLANVNVDQREEGEPQLVNINEREEGEPQQANVNIEEDVSNDMSGFFELMHRYMTYNKAHLKTLLSQHDLKCNGSKADLILRILKSRHEKGEFGRLEKRKHPDVPDCCVCLGAMVPPIITCQNGHSTCNDCAQKLKKCPTCRVDMKTVFRNFTAEHIFAKSIVECPYGGEHCGGIQYDQLETHREVCPFVHRCFVTDCQFMSEQETMEKHLKMKHKLTQLQVSMDLMKGGGLLVDITSTKTDPVWIKCGPNSFFIFHQNLYEGSITVLTCAMIGPVAIPDTQVTLQHGGNSYRGKCIPFEKLDTQFLGGLVLASQEFNSTPQILFKCH